MWLSEMQLQSTATEERAVLLRHCSLHPASSPALLPGCKAHLHRLTAAGRQENGLGGKLLGSFQTRFCKCFPLADPGVSSPSPLQPGLSSVPSDGQFGKGTRVLFGFCFALDWGR